MSFRLQFPTFLNLEPGLSNCSGKRSYSFGFFFSLNPFHASFINYLVHKFSSLLLARDEFEAEAQMIFITVLPIYLYIICGNLGFGGP